MFKKLRGMFSSDLSIDLGTANTLIYVRERGIVLNEPSVVAIRNQGNQKSVVGCRERRQAHAGAYPGQHLRHPSDEGRRDRRLQRLPRRCCSTSSTRCTRTAFLQPSAARADLRAVQVDPGRAPRDPRVGPRRRRPRGIPDRGADGRRHRRRPAGRRGPGSMVVDIGGGTTEVGLISLNGVVYAESVRVGGDKFDEAIITYVRRNYGILIGEATAERIKQEIGSRLPGRRSARNRRAWPQPGRGRAAQLHPELQRSARSAAGIAGHHRPGGEERPGAIAARAGLGHRRARPGADRRRRAAARPGQACWPRKPACR